MAIDRRGSQTIAGDRTWFYLLRSSAITIAGSQTIAEVCFHMIADDRRPYCDLRSAIIWRPAFMFYLLRSSAIVCDHDRRIAEVCFHMIADDRRRSQTIADPIAICDLRSAIIWKPAFTSRRTTREVSYEYGLKTKTNHCQRHLLAPTKRNILHVLPQCACIMVKNFRKTF